MPHKFSLLIVLILLHGFVGAFAINQQREIDSTKCSSQIGLLTQQFGRHLDCPKEYKLQMLIALSYYPELKYTPIKVEFSNIGTTASSRPSIWSIFAKHGSNRNDIDTNQNRKYTIRINVKKGFKGVLLKDVPFNAQIGILGHEIAHVADYENRNLFQLMGRAIDYLGNHSKIEFENEIDKLTIAHGLGWQLYDWADFVMNKSNATEEYKAFKRKTYMNPLEIEGFITAPVLLGENKKKQTPINANEYVLSKY